MAVEVSGGGDHVETLGHGKSDNIGAALMQEANYQLFKASPLSITWGN